MKIDAVYNSRLDADFSRFSIIYETLINEWETLSGEVPNAKHAYEMKYAEAIKKAEGTAQVKEADATLATKDERFALLKSEAKLEFIKAKVRWADKELSILQTRASNARSEAQLSSLPQPRWDDNGR